MSWLFDHEIHLKVGLSVLCAGLVLWPERRGKPALDEDSPAGRRASWRLKLSAGLALFAWLNFGTFHGSNWLHHWELFHYALGSKYFPEVGYDGLYVASAGAQLDTMNFPLQGELRDLRTNEVVPTSSLQDHVAEVKGRFTKARWKQFGKDQFAVSGAIRTPLARQDHGYNPTPTWTFVARLLDAHVPLTRASLTVLSFVDMALLVVMWIVLFGTYGSRVGCLAMTVFGLSYASRFYWNGGALLRYDWLVAIVVGTCLLRRGRHAWAGAAFAYAAMVRVFPAFLLIGPALVALRQMTRHEDWRWARRLALGFTVTAAACFLAGSMTGRGVAAWPQFARNIAKHQRSWLTNNVGLQNLVLYDAATFEGGMVNTSITEPWLPWQQHMTERKARLRPVILGLAALAVGLLSIAAWRSKPDEAAALGPGFVFALLSLTSYYWAMLLLVPLRGRNVATGVLVLANGALFALDLTTDRLELLFGVLSWVFAVLLVAWIGKDVLRAFRKVPAS